MEVDLPDPRATQALGRRLAAALGTVRDGALIALRGELGAGKTALARAIIQALGHDGLVVSPTYTLLEPYRVGQRRLCHLDLYRLSSPEELEFLGLRELVGTTDWLLVEWPERGAGFLPAADLEFRLSYRAAGRVAHIMAATAVGHKLLEQLRHASGKREDSADI